MANKKKIIQGGVDVQTSAGVSALTVDETTGAVTVANALDCTSITTDKRISKNIGLTDNTAVTLFTVSSIPSFEAGAVDVKICARHVGSGTVARCVKFARVSYSRTTGAPSGEVSSYSTFEVNGGAATIISSSLTVVASGNDLLIKITIDIGEASAAFDVNATGELIGAGLLT
jgi:hypothetical protein